MSEPENRHPDYKMWLAVLILPISRGKGYGQAGHAFGRLYLSARDAKPAEFAAYLENNEPKISVKVTSTDQLLRVATECQQAGIPYQLVRDAGHTELPPGTATVCAFGPALRSELPKFLARLQFLKPEDDPILPK